MRPQLTQRAHRLSSAPRRIPPVFMAALLLALQGCDPCNRIGGCEGTARLTITGRVLNESSGSPADAYVDFIRTGGVALNADSTRTRTESDGVFTLRVGAPGPGTVTGEIAVRGAATGGFGYRVFDQSFRVTGDAGDANVLPVWSTQPSLPDLGLLTSSFYPPANLARTQIEFRRTGGVALAQGDVFRTTSNDGGLFPLFDRQRTPLDAGDVIGELHVDVQGFVLLDFRVRATAEFRRNAGVRFVEVTGPAARVRGER